MKNKQCKTKCINLIEVCKMIRRVIVNNRLVPVQVKGCDNDFNKVGSWIIIYRKTKLKEMFSVEDIQVCFGAHS